jgi:hypothetical protein
VSLEREWRPTLGGQLLYMTDVWRSTDGSPHTVLADYSEVFGAETQLSEPGMFEFPGKAGFATTTDAENVALPAGTGALLYEEDSATPESGDLTHPFGALVYDLAPSEALHVVEGSVDTERRNSLYMPYRLTVPAAGTRTLRMAYAQSLTLPEARTLAASAQAAFHPIMGISSPSVGSTIVTPTATVTPRPNTLKLGVLKVAKGQITFAITCRGPVHSNCGVRALLSTLEHLHGARITGLAARRKTRTVTAGSYKATIAEGRRTIAVLRLDATGRRLLARFRKLPGRLSVMLLSGAGVHQTVLSQKVTVTPPRHALRGTSPR